MQCYTELTPPTAVTYSVTLPFLSAQSHNLVVAKKSLLQVFELVTISTEIDNSNPATGQTERSADRYDSRRNDDDGLESSFLGGDAFLVRADRTTNTRLVLVAEFPLSGVICGLARIKLPSTKSGGEALLVATRVARMTLCEWDPATRSISSISLHFYEGDEYQGAPNEAKVWEYDTYLEADPGSRCAALKFAAKYLAIVPFRQTDDADIDMDDWDEDLDGPRPAKQTAVTTTVNGAGGGEGEGESDTRQTSDPSFVLRIPQLDSSLLHTRHFSFLHEYREPTLGILSSMQRPVVGRRDHLLYKVLTLDLKQKASTIIISVDGLPQDLHRVVPLKAPVGGALLVGDNELIHIDQSGKPNGVAVNPFTKELTSFALVDQSHLNLRLEHCVIADLSTETGELLMILGDGRLAIISFSIDGRTVSGISVRLVPQENGGELLGARARCLTKLDKNSFFVGSDFSDSHVIGWTRKQNQTSKKRSRLLDASLEFEIDDLDLEDEEDDDDLYGESTATNNVATNGSAAAVKGGPDIMFRIHDTLMSIAPVREFTSGKASFFPGSEEEHSHQGVVGHLQLIAAVGRQKAGSVAIMNRLIQPKVIGRFEFPEARGFWTMSVQKPIPKLLQGDKGGVAMATDFDPSTQYDKFMIVSKVDLDGYETSDVYALTPAGFEALTGTEFEPAAGFTVAAGTMCNHKRVIQVLKSEVRCYDGDLGLSQILPMLNEETGAEPRVVSASIDDSYLLIIRDDSTVLFAQMDNNNELEEMDRLDDKLVSSKWSMGCIYRDYGNRFYRSPDATSTAGEPNVLAFLVTASGALSVYRLPDLSTPVFVADGLFYIPDILHSTCSVPRRTQKEAIREIMVADLGDATHKSPYLIARHATDDITIYEPLYTEAPSNSSELRLRKVSNPALATGRPEAAQEDSTPETRLLPLQVCPNIGGYSAVFVPGTSPSFILRSSRSMPKVIGLQGAGVRGMSPFHTEGCERGFIYADSHGIARVTQFPSDTSFELGISVKKVPFNVDVKHVAYHTPTGMYALGCGALEPFELPKDEPNHPEWTRENIEMKPNVSRGHVKLISPVTWTEIQDVEMEPCEDILCMKALELEVSEVTKERRQLIAVGTSIGKGEDLPVRGRIYVYDIVTVIPEPGRPETNKKLKLIAKEDIPRGAVTALSEVGSQGLMLVAQGQKCMVRGLKEDGSLLPVAFMDMSTYVTAAKELRGNSLCLMSDAYKGVWLTGYSEEPYKMQLFGKSNTRLCVRTADFLPDQQQDKYALFIVVSDVDGDLHILQYEPEHPKAYQGHLLLHRQTFSTRANQATAMMLLPRSTAAEDDAGTTSRNILLIGSNSGMLAAMVPLEEQSYRHLVSLTGHLINALPPWAATSPRGYRTPPSDAPEVGVESSASSRTVIDGALLLRWNELGTRERWDLARKARYEAPDAVRVELERLIGWAGVAYY